MKKLDDLTPLKETLKQKIQLKAQRMRRYEKRTKFYRKNNTFKTDKKKFYKELEKSQVNVEKPPSKEEVETFWTSIWGTEKDYNEDAQSLKPEEERCEDFEEQEWDEIEVEEVKEALRKAQKWKSPGIDKVPNFWLNTFDAIHENTTNCFNRAITNSETNLKWFTQGIKYLIPKFNETNISKNYRPITCLSTIYKILMSIVTERTYNFLDANNILPSEQKGYKKRANVRKQSVCHSKLSTAWIDYRNAFDSVPYTWILKVLQMYKISPTIINFLTASIEEWKTNLYLDHSHGRTICEKHQNYVWDIPG